MPAILSSRGRKYARLKIRKKVKSNKKLNEDVINDNINDNIDSNIVKDTYSKDKLKYGFNINNKKKKSSNNTFFYDIHNSTLLVLFISIAIILSIIGLFVVKYFVPPEYLLFETNGMVGIFMGAISISVSIIISFIISGTWQSYNDAFSKEVSEATNLVFLYNALEQLPKTKNIKKSVVSYIQYIINDEFIQMQNGNIDQKGMQMLLAIGNKIYQYNPITAKDNTLYKETINLYNELLKLRTIRIGYSIYGVSPELHWVLIIGVILIICMSWFIYTKRHALHYFLTAAIAAGFAGMLFLIVALDFPYKGDFGLDSMPFQMALDEIMKLQ